MSSDLEYGGNDEDVFGPLIGDAYWGFDGLDNDDDWGLFDALAANSGNVPPSSQPPSSSNTFHNPPSAPPRPASINPVNDAAAHRPGDSNNSSAPTNPSDLPHQHPPPLHLAAERRRQIPPRTTNTSYSEDDLSFSENSDGFDVDDILGENYSASDRDNMPPRSRPRRRENGGSIVDLTNDSSPPATSINPSRRPRSLKRAAEEAASGPSTKRTKRNPHSTATTDSNPDTPVEHLDLTNEAPSAEDELAAAQSAATILSQQAPPIGPLKIGQRNCIICMEPFTNATITHCGHIYCHECLTQALQAGEKNGEGGKASCPVCRKEVKRKGKNQVVPVVFMKRAAFEGKGRSRAGGG